MHSAAVVLLSCSPTRMLLLCLCFISTLRATAVASLSSASLSSRASAGDVTEYPVAWPVTQIAYDPYSDALVVAAQHRLLRLSSDLSSQLVTCSLGNSSLPCTSGAPLVTAGDGTAELLLVESSEHVVVCGMYLGQCERRSLVSLSPSVQPSLSRPLTVSNATDARTLGTLLRSTTDATSGSTGSTLYVATTQIFSAIKVLPRDSLYAVAARATGTNFSLLSEALPPCQASQPCWPSGIRYSDNTVGSGERFVSVVTARGKVYIVKDDNRAGARVIGLCTSESRWGRYVDLPLACGDATGEILSAVLGTASQTLWDTMGGRARSPAAAAGSEQSADTLFMLMKGTDSKPLWLCAYGLDALNAAFETAYRLCYLGSGSNNRSTTVVKKESGYNEACTPTTDTTTYKQLCDQTFEDVQRLFVYQSSNYPIPADLARPVQIPGNVASFNVDTVNSVTVAYIASYDGASHKFHKVVVDGSAALKPYENVTLNADGDLQAPVVLNAAKNAAYVYSSRKVLRVNLANCGTSPNCTHCVQRSDPHCGWCSLLRRCTAYSECQYSRLGPSHWLTLGSSPQCFGSIVDNSKISATTPQTAVPVALYKVPTEPGVHLTCCFFNDTICNTSREDVAVMPRSDGRSVLLSCPMPSVGEVRSRLGPHESIDTVMSLRVGQQTFDGVALTFYNCSFHRRCLSCARTIFPCKWLLQGSMCSDAADVPVQEDQFIFSSSADVWKSCPRIALQPEGQGLFAHVGYEATFALELLAKQAFQDSFKCIFVGPGHSSGSIVVPAGYTASAGSGNKGVLTCTLGALPDPREMNLKVSWSSTDDEGLTEPIKYLDNQQDINVTVYRCSSLAKFCGRCLMLDLVYNCGWCELGDTGQCSGRSQCSGNFIQRPSVCRNPTIDNFFPKFGPTEGDTLITVTGQNLGLNNSDIGENIAIVSNATSGPVREVKCAIESYEPSQRIVCRTPESVPLVGHLRVTVRAQSGQDQQQAVSSAFFEFARPEVKEIRPKQGPVSGGTSVTISGKYLGIGSSMSVSFGNALPCQLPKREAGRPESTIQCTTPKMSVRPGPYDVSVRIDKFLSINREWFTYNEDPTIDSVIPRDIIRSGGISITVTGQRLDVVQEPRLYFELRRTERTGSTSTRRKRRQVETSPTPPLRVYSNCSAQNSTYITCLAPSTESLLNLSDSAASESHKLAYGFVMDGVTSVLDLSSSGGDLGFEFEAHPDPEFFGFKDGKLSIPLKSNQTATIPGRNIARLPKSVVDRELRARLGGKHECTIMHFVDTAVVCMLPPLDTAQELQMVVSFGNRLNFSVGTVAYEDPEVLSLPVIAGIVGGVAGLCIIVVIIIVVLVAKARKSDRDAKSLKAQMDNLEMRVAKECKEAFAELQTDITEMNSDESGSSGLPFFDYRTYCMKVLFPNASVAEHPVVCKLEIYDKQESIENGIRKFGDLICEKTFLLIFIRTLEANSQFTMRDRVYVASLVSVALQGKMVYHTDILKTLLSDLIEKSVTGGSGPSGGAGKGHPRLLLRRTESVAEKMLTNWFTFLLHKFLRECAGEPLFLLYRAIKQQIDKGPVDAITGEAKYSLSEDKLLRQQIDYNVLSLALLSPEAEAYTQPQIIKVLDCDCPSQALDKILDIVYRNLPHSSDSRPSRDRVDLQWIQPQGQRTILRDDDVVLGGSTAPGEWKRRKTLAQYGLVDNSLVALVPRLPSMSSHSGMSLKHGHGMMPDSASGTHSHTSSMHGLNHSSSHSSMPRANSQSNMLAESSSKRVYHLVKPHDSGDAQAANDRDKMVSEVYLTRLLATKGTLQNFVDDLFETIFSTTHRGSALPLAIKYMFDFLDDQALSHGILEPEVIHTWKSNSLPLRFWVNVIKNPDFVFDIHKSNIVDACLSVVAQIFMESCSQSDFRLGKDSPSSKLLYAKDIPKYRKWVERYYQDIKQMPGISDPDMNSILNEESRQHTNDFNTSAALYELYKYVQNYSAEICEALEDDEFARRYHLLQKLEQVDKLMGVARTHL